MTEYLMAENDQPILLTDKQAALKLNISRSKLWQLVQDGLLPVVKLPPRTTRFNFGDLQKIANDSVKVGHDWSQEARP